MSRLRRRSYSPDPKRYAFLHLAAAKAVVGKLIRRLQVRFLPGVQSSVKPDYCNECRSGPTEETGDVAEWLGKGLQNPVRRFESARDDYSGRGLAVRGSVGD